MLSYFLISARLCIQCGIIQQVSRAQTKEVSTIAVFQSLVPNTSKRWKYETRVKRFKEGRSTIKPQVKRIKCVWQTKRKTLLYLWFTVKCYLLWHILLWLQESVLSNVCIPPVLNRCAFTRSYCITLQLQNPAHLSDCSIITGFCLTYRIQGPLWLNMSALGISNFPKMGNL